MSRRHAIPEDDTYYDKLYLDYNSTAIPVSATGLAFTKLQRAIGKEDLSLADEFPIATAVNDQAINFLQQKGTFSSEVSSMTQTLSMVHEINLQLNQPAFPLSW